MKSLNEILIHTLQKLFHLCNFMVKGWWQYDARTCEELEEAYMQKLTNVEILICGELYVINFKENFQFPKRNPSKKRYIKRDIPRNLDVKGIAGIR